MTRWQALLGNFEVGPKEITFLGEPRAEQDLATGGLSVGNLISEHSLAGGSVSATVSFDTLDEHTACDLILFYQPTGPDFLTAGIGGGALFTVRSFVGGRWNYHATSGDRRNLRAQSDYQIKVTVHGSRVLLTVGGVDVLATTLPVVPPPGQAGIWCAGRSHIRIRNFSVDGTEPTAFVVMQFSKPYDELYREVIKPICSEFHVHAIRADETFGPGFILADIARQISEAYVVIAEITPPNQNVYYELGLAHAWSKPTILIAEKDTHLPFDVSPFRTLFYENSIEGKSKIEAGFRKHLGAVLSSWRGIRP